MKKRITRVIIFIFLCVSLPALIADEFSFSSDRVTSVFAKGKERTLLSGNAKIRSDANNINADEIELYGEDSTYAMCRGSVRLVNIERGLELSCDELFYDRSQKIARVHGNAVMVDRKNEVVVKGGFIENRETDDITIIQIGVRVLKKDMSCRSEFAKYMREIDTLELTGMPIVFWKGDEYQAQKIIINLKKDEVKLEGSVQGEINTEKKDETKPETTPETKPEMTPETKPDTKPDTKPEMTPETKTEGTGVAP